MSPLAPKAISHYLLIFHRQQKKKKKTADRLKYPADFFLMNHCCSSEESLYHTPVFVFVSEGDQTCSKTECEVQMVGCVFSLKTNFPNQLLPLSDTDVWLFENKVFCGCFCFSLCFKVGIQRLISINMAASISLLVDTWQEKSEKKLPLLLARTRCDVFKHTNNPESRHAIQCSVI